MYYLQTRFVLDVVAVGDAVGVLQLQLLLQLVAAIFAEPAELEYLLLLLLQRKEVCWHLDK
jgi:hypothetical protein